MGYFEDKLAQARALKGKRIEIPVHYDTWMRGARFGTVKSVGRDGECVTVEMDHPQIRKLLKVWRMDFDHVKVL